MADSASTLNCLMCGAATRKGLTHCEHCGARLATVACPECFGMIFQGSKFCNHCGAAANRREDELSGLRCPHCDTPLKYIWLGKIEVAECGACDGLWLENSAFETLCADREQQAAVFGTALPVPAEPTPVKVTYVKCPLCGILMERQNFAGSSGVVVDVCKAHGTWFDVRELQRIISFIRGGGLERAREKQIQEWEETRLRLEEERRRLRDELASENPDLKSNDNIITAIAEVIASLRGRR